MLTNALGWDIALDTSPSFIFNETWHLDVLHNKGRHSRTAIKIKSKTVKQRLLVLLYCTCSWWTTYHNTNPFVYFFSSIVLFRIPKILYFHLQTITFPLFESLILLSSIQVCNTIRYNIVSFFNCMCCFSIYFYTQ